MGNENRAIAVDRFSQDRAELMSQPERPNFRRCPRRCKGRAVVSIGNFVKVIYWVLVPCNKIVAIRSVSCAVQFRAPNESRAGEGSCSSSSSELFHSVMQQPARALHHNRTLKPVAQWSVRETIAPANMFASDRVRRVFFFFFFFREYAVRVQPHGANDIE